MVWLDLTRKCQLECAHCYNASGPGGTHGTMERQDWFGVVDQAARAGAGHLQLIGGEPTLHPHAPDIAEHALEAGLGVEVFSNLVHLSPRWWELLRREGMSLATSYYSADPARHNAVTARPSHRRTRANIAKAVALGVPLRVGIIAVGPGEGVEAAVEDLESLGATDVGTDRVRPFGRGGRERPPDVSGLCGNCGSGTACVGPTGEVSPCAMSSWMGVGNVADEELSAILSGPAMARAVSKIRAGKKQDGDQPPPQNPCEPDRWCKPGTPNSGCAPRR
ncbi:radical SAM protein [Nocardiopsis sp. CNT-189]